MDRRDPKTGKYVPATAPPEQRFAASIEYTDTCHLWRAGLTGAGYGAFYPGSTQVGAHVWVWEHHNGPTPAGMVIDHTCRVRDCVRIEHLQLCSRGDNVLRSPESNAGRNMRKTHCLRGHPLSGENLVTHPNFRNPERPPWRSCRECTNERKREHRKTLRSNNQERGRVP